MSYCRWSSDDFQCDLYCYEDCAGGWTTHVAGRRVRFTQPLPPHIVPDMSSRIQDLDFYVKSAERMSAVMKLIDSAEYEPITLPYAGERFNDDTLTDFLARLLELRKIGYLFPDFVLNDVQNEIAAQGVD